MTIPLFTTPVPTTADPDNFAARADILVSELNPFVTSLNDFATALNSLSTTDTSATSNTVGTGSKTFTVTAGKSFFVGMSLTIANTAAPTNRMFAVVTSYSGTTLQVTSQAFEGSGTFTAWSISASFNGIINTGQLADLGTTNTKLSQQYINDLTTVAALGADYIAIADTSDSGNKKKALISDIQTQFASNAEYATGTDTTKALNSATARARNIVAGTSVATTSGVSVDFTGLPSWVKRITVIFNGVSTTGTSTKLVQIGAGSVTTSGYVSTGAFMANGISANVSSSTSGFIINSTAAADILDVIITIVNMGGNVWVCSHTGKQATNTANSGSGDISLGGTLDRVRITTSGGTDTFDAGSVNIFYE